MMEKPQGEVKVEVTEANNDAKNQILSKRARLSSLSSKILAFLSVHSTHQIAIT